MRSFSQGLSHGSLIAMYNSRIAAAFFLLVLTVRGGPSEPEHSSGVDQTPAITIGSHTVSHYLVDKYFHRFTEEQERHGAGPSEDASRAWLQTFVSKQCVIAHLESLGYFNLPEVTSSVARMERQVLIQPNGPFYESLLKSLPEKSPEELAAIYDRLPESKNSIIATFPNGVDAASLLGADFDTCAFEEQMRRIGTCHDQHRVPVFDGTISWPYRPFVEITDIIFAAPLGQWIKHQDPAAGTHYIFIRSVLGGHSAAPLADSTGFQFLVKRVQEETFQHSRRNTLLASSALTWDDTSTNQLVEILANLQTPNNEIPPETIRAVGPTTLFRYHLGPETITVSSADFCRSFNSRYVRKIPRTTVDVKEAGEAMVIEERDYREARALGIDRTAKFAEDRLGFAGFQVLDLYERKNLMPAISIEPVSIDRYYREHQADFRRVTRVRARRLEFHSLVEAQAWRRQQSAGPAAIPGIGDAPFSSEDVDVVVGQTIPGFENLADEIFRSPEGFVLGPVPARGAYLCIIKLKNVESAPVPLDFVREEIGRILMRQALDSSEAAMAVEIAKAMPVENHLELARYGIPASKELVSLK